MMSSSGYEQTTLHFFRKMMVSSSSETEASILAMAFRLSADELSVNEDMVALVERAREGLAEAVEGHDAVPLGFRLPLVVRVFPRLLRGDRENREGVSVAAHLALLRVFPEEAN